MYIARQFQQGDYASPHIRTHQDIEYDLFLQVTRDLQNCDATGKGPQALAAICRNNELWTALALDLAQPDNSLPDGLKAQLISLANFSFQHGQKVMGGQGDTSVLIDINLKIMKGLKGVVSA